MALLPFISTLVTVDLDSHLGADERADGAAGALIVLLELGRQIAGGVGLAGGGDHLFGTERGAEQAALAQLRTNLDITFRHDHTYNYIWYFKLASGCKLAGS